jgi:heterodisulfide reductase subunit C
VGINLEELWFNLKRHAANLGYPKPEKWARDTIGSDYVINKFNEETLPLSFGDITFSNEVTGHAHVDSFSVCFGCRNCTSVCPVVGSYESPRKALGLLPHEIMHCLALRQKELALGSMMLWECLTCYLCQEQCPQGVCITDILYQLKNLSLQKMKQEA